MTATPKHRLRSVTLPLALAALVPTACHEGAEDGDDAMCGEAKCDDLGELGQALAGFNDPIATWLKANLDKNGQIDVAYLDMLEAIAKQQGCDKASIDSYIISDALVVDGKDPFPRVVNTVCSGDRTKADLAFFALSFADEAGVDLEPREIEMFAWDAAAFQYRFYAGHVVEGSDTKVALELDPSRCHECHEQAPDIPGLKMPMTPIMNELSAPWQHWHAEPVSFDHTVPAATEKAPMFKLLAGEGSAFRKSAARLEQTIRSAFQQRVATARLRLRRNPANVDEAMSLLRPLFCDEHLTFVTEDGGSGLLSAASVVDDGLASVYFQIKGTGWPWEWWNDKMLRLTPPGAPDRITMMATRGQAMVAYEKQALSTRALTTDQVMRVRALGWNEPTMSALRCGLFQNALPRVQSDPPPFAAGAKNLDLFPLLIDRILTVHKGDFGLGGSSMPNEVALVSPDAGKFITLAKGDGASLQTLVDAIVAKSLATATCGTDGSGFCLATADSFGAMIEARFKAIEAAPRTALTAQRNQLACQAKERYPNAPHIGDLDCSMVMPPGDSGGDTTGGDTTGGETTGGGADTTGGAVDVGDCCSAHAGSGCSNDTIEACVCATDDVCCTTAWDDVCVGEVVSAGCAPSCG
ncbi:MAG: hypothetical protein K1X88_28630 [Nannocystaceae bacterium]|nr:hypothetical protein [Nannocystaceae bacterium]